jgi:hypothetical protein
MIKVAEKKAEKTQDELTQKAVNERNLEFQKKLAIKQAADDKLAAFNAAKKEGKKNAEDLTKEMETDLRKERQQNNTKERFALSQNSEGTSEAYLKSVAAEKAEAEAKALALKEQTLQSLEESKATQRKLKDNANTTPIGGDIRKRKEDIDKLNANAKTTPLGEGVDAERKRLLDEEKFKSSTSSSVGSNAAKAIENDRQIQRNLAEEKKEKERTAVERQVQRSINDEESHKSSLKQKIAENKHNKYQNDRIDRIADISDSAARNSLLGDTADNVAPPTGPINKYRTIGVHDPYAFSTLAYPSDVTNNGENGHYILFYVNVQNKTKYDYQSGRDASVRVGDYAERTKEHQGKDNDSLYKTLDISAQEALNATTSANTIALLNGANILRVHDVKEAVEAIKIVNKTS